MKIKDIVLISGFASISFIVEQVLSLIPNVQLTFLLIIVYSKVFKLRNTAFIILIHVLLDCLFTGSLNLLYFPFMLIGYLIIPITLVFIKSNSEILLALLSIVFSILYCLIFVIPSCLLTGIKITDYLIADIPFMIILAISSFISVLWLYKPISSKLNELTNNM